VTAMASMAPVRFLLRAKKPKIGHSVVVVVVVVVFLKKVKRFNSIQISESVPLQSSSSPPILISWQTANELLDRKKKKKYE
jgi:hypothetical protein